MADRSKGALTRLYTREGRALSGQPWARYPRPQMRRKDWLCLNGDWELSWDGKQRGIRVPFCPESLLSGLEQAPEIGKQMRYRRAFTCPESWRGRRVLLHFGAVSREAAVFLNGRELGRHHNAYTPFTLDVTDAIQAGENELSLSVVNDLDWRYPRGKQSKKRGGMWYTPCSGIWQTVWLEPVPEQYIRGLRLRSGADWVEVRAEGVREGELVWEGGRVPLRDGLARVRVPSPRLWSPEEPNLYSFTLQSGEDRVESYFALRTLTTETIGGVPRLCLNGMPYFFHGVLDQGYWSDGLYTPASPDCYERDIRGMKELGFNTLRKHIKLEPEQFYYDCDRLGMAVFQDMVCTGPYHYLRDTVLPTLHVKKRRDRALNPDREMQRQFLQSMEETVRLLSNHPCICLWTIFNEGWGQFEADEAYRRLRALDDSRFIDSTSGWYRQRESDVESLHYYFEKPRLEKPRRGEKPRPQLLSEFGGFVWKLPEHSFNREKTYGYRQYDSRETLVAALRDVYSGELLPLVRHGLCGAIYTQLSDVEDETNGLFSFDREVLKVRPEELRDLAGQLRAAVLK